MYVRTCVLYVRTSITLGDQTTWERIWRGTAHGSGRESGRETGGDQEELVFTYVRMYPRTYVPTGVRTYVLVYVHTYVHVCGWVFQCLRLYRYVTYVRQLEGGKVDSGKVLFGTALDEHCGWRLVLLRPAAPSAGGAQLTSRLRRKWRPTPGPKPFRGSSSHGGRE